MTDIVDELRYGHEAATLWHVAREAADTIEALRAENAKLRAALKEARVKSLNEGFDIAILFNGMRRSEIAQAFERAKAAALKGTEG